MYKFGESFEIPIVRDEANFDRACDSARQYAFRVFEIDENGHTEKFPSWQRNLNCIEVKFVSYVCAGHEHCYVFEIKAV